MYFTHYFCRRSSIRVFKCIYRGPIWAAGGRPGATGGPKGPQGGGNNSVVIL